MYKGRKQTFGALVRRERQQLKIGLREMARRIGVSPTYLSMIERDEFPPPAEDKVTAIADIIGQDRNELLALAGRVSSDLEAKIMSRPRQVYFLVEVLMKSEHFRKSDAEDEMLKQLRKSIFAAWSDKPHNSRRDLKKLSDLLLVLLKEPSSRAKAVGSSSSNRRK